MDIEFRKRDEGIGVYRHNELFKIGLIQNHKFIPAGHALRDHELEQIFSKMKELQQTK